MSTPAEHSSCYALRREKSKSICVQTGIIDLQIASGDADQSSGPWRCLSPCGRCEGSWATFEVGGHRVALPKSSDFDRRSSHRQQQGDHLAIEIGLEVRRQVFQCWPTETALRAGTGVENLLATWGVDQGSIRLVGALRDGDAELVSEILGTFPVTVTSHRLMNIEAKELTSGFSPAAIRHSLPRRYASAAAT